MTHATLPPDPESKNDARAAWAGEAIAVFMRAADRLCILITKNCTADQLRDLRHDAVAE
jgi:hypothetical protein